jgi:hypothetical protein
MILSHPLPTKLFEGLDALDRQDMPGYLDAIARLQYYARDYGDERAARLLDEVSHAWSLMRSRCAYCGERRAYHDPRG